MKIKRLMVPRALKLRIHKDGKIYGQISKSNGEFYISPEVLAILSYFADPLKINPATSQNIAQYLKKHFQSTLQTLPNSSQCTEIIADLLASGFLFEEEGDTELALQNDGFGDSWIQWAMISDTRRSIAYEQAIAKHMSKNSVVLDVGSGTGFLSACALKHGAKKVYAIEESNISQNILPNLKNLNLIAKKGEIKNFTLHANNSFDVQLTSDINLVVSELFGNDPFQEGLYSTLHDISKRIKNKDVEYIPKKLVVYGEIIDLVNHPAKHRIELFQQTDNKLNPAGSTFYPKFLNSIKQTLSFESISFPINLTDKDFTRLSASVNLGECQLNPPPKETQFAKCFTGKKTIKVDYKTEGASLFIFWFRVYLTDEISISSHPKEADYAYHWSPIAVVLNKHIPGKSNLEIKYQLNADLSLFECKIFEKNILLGQRT